MFYAGVLTLVSVVPTFACPPIGLTSSTNRSLDAHPQLLGAVISLVLYSKHRLRTRCLLTLRMVFKTFFFSLFRPGIHIYLWR